MLTQRRMFSVLLLVSVFMIPAMSFGMDAATSAAPAPAPAAASANTTTTSATPNPYLEKAANGLQTALSTLNAPLNFLVGAESKLGAFTQYSKLALSAFVAWKVYADETVQQYAGQAKETAKRALGFGKAKCEKACAKTTCTKALVVEEEDEEDCDDCE